jgi:signal transduction histidine kinase
MAGGASSCHAWLVTTQWRGLFMRSDRHRLATGVAGGLADTLRVDPILVRLAFVVLTVASGLGLALYLAAWALSTPPAAGAAHELEPARMSGARSALAMGSVILGALLILRDVGLWFGDSLVWPIVLAACGSALIWVRSDATDRARWTAAGGRIAANPVSVLGTGGGGRLIVGGVFVLAGMGVFLVGHQSAGALGTVLLAVVVTAGGLGLILAPWMLRLVREAAVERRQRVRSEERAEIAAHLHDSVLHTLVLVQRGDVPAEVVSLARRQERELRAWLNGRPVDGEAVDLRAAIDAVATRVEEMHQVPVDTVVVGDIALDDAGRAIALACQEAAINAARHSGAQRVSIYVEAEPREITAYVRDEGRGFERGAVPPDRRGISESIVGRMRRLSGSATITSAPGQGTEVQLHIPRSPG